MIKKIITIVSVVCVIVANVASTSLAGLSYSNKHVNSEYNGSVWGQRGYLDATATSQNYSVTVGIEKNNIPCGTITTTVYAGHTQTCSSKFVQGNDGTLYYFPEY